MTLSFASYAENTPAATDATDKVTSDKAFEFSTLAHKENLTSGYFDCMARTQSIDPDERCLLPELKFQTHVLGTVVKEYGDLLSKSQLADFNKVQKGFEDYMVKRCDWYNKNNLQKKTRLIDEKNVYLMKLQCLLETTMTRRLELEELVPETEGN